jgi:uncharacterized protein (TIGR03000 family)
MIAQPWLKALTLPTAVMGVLFVWVAPAFAQQPRSEVRGGGPIWLLPEQKRTVTPNRGRAPSAARMGYLAEDDTFPDYRSFYQLGRAIPNDAALVEVRVPRNAEVWFSGEKTNSTGREREFLTPELKDGKSYFYTIKARWTQNGQPVEQTRRVKVAPGAHVMVDFYRRAPESKNGAAKPAEDDKPAP